MATFKILVLGGTGPAGICLLRELVHRNHPTIVYARNPSKIPQELLQSPMIKCVVQIIKGELGNTEALSTAVAQCSVILSLLGPQISQRISSPTFFADCYKATVFPLMRHHGVTRIVAMGTISIQRPEDRWALTQLIIVAFVRLFANAVYQNITNLAQAFDQDAQGLDWTVFRIAQIPGESDEASWRKDRGDGNVFTGWIGEKGWTSSIRRAALARWLVDAAEGESDEWFHKMPGVSKLASS